MSLKVLYMGVLAGSAALLSGCAANSMHLDSQSPLRDRAYVKANFLHRAFVLGSVTLAKNQMVPTDVHPLPSNAYLKLIRRDLVLAFHDAHLDRGQKPADVVDIHVTRLRFISDNTTPHFWSGFSMSANVLTHVTSTLTITNSAGRSLAVARIKPYDSGGAFYGYWHAPRWDYCRRTIPLTAIFTVRAIENLRDGRPLNDGSLGTQGSLVVQHIDDEDLGEYGIKSLSKKEIEDITGYSRQQLHDFDKPW